MYKVLIVDDEKIIRSGLIHMLSWEEFGVSELAEASNGEEALDMLDTLQPHIVITDIKMPKINGLQLIGAAKQRYHNLKFIITSGFDDFDYVKQSILFGIENYLLKPINENELRNTVLNTIEKMEKEQHDVRVNKSNHEIILNNVLVRLILNNIERNEFVDRFDFLNISLKKGYFIIALVHVPEFHMDDIFTWVERIKRVMDHCNRKTIHAFLFPDYEKNLILFMNAEGDVNNKTLIYEYLENVMNRIDEDIWIALGTPQDRIEQVWISYRDARNIRHAYKLLPPNRVIDAEILENRLQKHSIDKITEVEKIKESILHKNKPEISRHLNDLYHSSKQWSESQLRDSTDFFLILLHELVHLAEDLGIRSTDLYAKDTTLYSSLHLKDFFTVIEWFKQFGIHLIDMLLAEKSRSQSLIDKVIAYLYMNFDYDLSIKTLSNEFQITPAYLGQLFKNQTGVLFTEYLNQIRIEEAKKLILHSELKLYEIAKRVGYTNTNYFFSVFRKYVGVTPTVFLELHGRK